jgi:hypothetical protein
MHRTLYVKRSLPSALTLESMNIVGNKGDSGGIQGLALPQYSIKALKDEGYTLET